MEHRSLEFSQSSLGDGVVLPLPLWDWQAIILLQWEENGCPSFKPAFSPILSSDAMRLLGSLPNDVMDRAEGLVYMVVNKLDGSKYIGATATSLEQRWRSHVSKSKREIRSPLHYDLRKRGQNAFEVFQIASCLHIEYLAALEAACIEQFKPEYNRTVPEHVWEYLL